MGCELSGLRCRGAQQGEAGSSLWALGTGLGWGGALCTLEEACWSLGTTWHPLATPLPMPGSWLGTSLLRATGGHKCGDGAGWDLHAPGSGRGCQLWTLPSQQGDNGGLRVPLLPSLPCRAGWAQAPWALPVWWAVLGRNVTPRPSAGASHCICMVVTSWGGSEGFSQPQVTWPCLSQMSGTVCRRKPSPSGSTSTSSRLVPVCARGGG